MYVYTTDIAYDQSVRCLFDIACDYEENFIKATLTIRTE